MSERHRPLPQLAFSFPAPAAVSDVPQPEDADMVLLLSQSSCSPASRDSETEPSVAPVVDVEAQKAPLNLAALKGADLKADAEAAADRTAGEEPKKRSKSKILIEALSVELGEPVKLVLTDNRSLLLSTTRRKGQLSARVHQMFLGGDESLLVAIAQFLARGDKAAGVIIDAFVEESGHLLELHVAPLGKNAGKGKVHDLNEIFDDVNRAYFGGAIDAEITWGQAGSFRGRRRRSITLGSYDSRAHRITMHPALDHAKVPKISVARVVHHEMLHIKHPTTIGPSGRRIVHSREFRAEEATFIRAKEADAWIDENLESILRYRPSRR